ncbi:hypothetical protein F443_19660 [Phytophthora nicotianae P1569]|uniref:Uncharacterized protein n=1 Tax=Phytophthora nicotianae P1569 TaxID=1317065 RepID=V9E5V8_PHYNI|nr:hypothetical protein F443_19660 [Phytophthora nicotianae P1569]
MSGDGGMSSSPAHQKENRTKVHRHENHLHQLHYRRENHCRIHPHRYRKNREIEGAELMVAWKLVGGQNAEEVTEYLLQRKSDKVTSAPRVHRMPLNCLEHPHRRQIQKK